MSALRSLLLVTLDSCRYDVAAALPDLFGAPPRPATSHGTFTLPSHTALFFGYPPTPAETVERCAPGLFGQVTATRAAHGGNWLDDLRHHGVRTVGAGGVRWFRHDRLRAGFDRFHYWGPPGDSDLPDAEPEHFALHHTDELVASLRGAPLWLLFVNAAETHAPYLAGADLLRAQRELGAVRNGKARLPDDPATAELMRTLWRAQRSALETAGRRLHRLLDALPRPFDYLICADHGESFGENGRWGHVHAGPEVMRVPMWMGARE